MYRWGGPTLENSDLIAPLQLRSDIQQGSAKDRYVLSAGLKYEKMDLHFANCIVHKKIFIGADFTQLDRDRKVLCRHKSKISAQKGTVYRLKPNIISV